MGLDISIHALREEGDVSPYRGDQQHAISIHALREEGDVMEMQPAFWQLLFLSTPSARRATRSGGTETAPQGISIHALREEGDVDGKTVVELDKLFLSTPSARRATS